MNFWINTVSLDHVMVGVEGNFTQANHGSPRNLQRMERGDWLAFYSPKTAFKDGKSLQKFTAIGQIVDDVPYQVQMRPGFKPFRRKVAFQLCDAVDIRPLIPTLTFIENKQRWGFPFRRGLFKIEKEDFLQIASAMNIALEK